MQVGIRELRADLSRLIKRVQEGEEIVVTDRGKPVARIVPATGSRRLDELIAAGVVTPAPHPSGSPRPAPVDVEGKLSDLVIEGRR